MKIESKKIPKRLYGNNGPWHCILFRHSFLEKRLQRFPTAATQVGKEAAAWEIHMVVSCPPHRNPCYYGIDFSTQGELLASQHSVEEIKNFIGLDSLCYPSLPGMLEAAGLGG